MVKCVGDFFFYPFSTFFLVSMLTVSAGKSKELQLPKDETALTCFVVEKEKKGRDRYTADVIYEVDFTLTA